jgi:DNA (cytosine-5)-methyltransferase 1
MGVSAKKRTSGKNPRAASGSDKSEKESGYVITTARIYEVAGKIIKATLFGPDNYKSAVISHYLQKKDKSLKKEAVTFAREILQDYLKDEVISDSLAEEAIHLLFNSGSEIFPAPEKPKFTFIDLFAGVGGFRIAMQNNGGECIFSSEWDKMAQRTYYSNFGEIPFGDITKAETKQWIPKNFDILCGGFPCQPFSIAGVSKKNSLGRKHGFEDEKQGNLFFHIAEIIEKHRPKAFFLENVKNLVSHDKGNTFKVIKETLLDLGYSFHTKVLNGKHFVPQHRERTFMVGFDSRIFKYREKFDFPELPAADHKVRSILEKKVDPKYTLTDHLWKYLQDYARKHKEKGNGFGFGLVNLDGISRTMSARYYKDGSEILIPQPGKNPRRLSIRESARLQGYPDHFFVEAVSMNQAYKQFGNSVVVPLIEIIGGKITEVITAKKNK